jgi:abortive infection bacteriophage resistance protein
MSQLSARIHYQKPWCSYSDLVALLRQRGLIVTDEPVAVELISHISYYRFSGYCLAFEVSRHQFIADTTLEQIVAAYKFDLTLRDLVTEALEVVEVDLRAAVAHLFGEKHGAFGHTQAATFFQPPPRNQYAKRTQWSFNHARWLEALHDETKRSKELFIQHFSQTYIEYPDIPVWVATEVMSFGSLSRMLEGMVKNDQKMISSRFQLQPHILAPSCLYQESVCSSRSIMGSSLDHQARTTGGQGLAAASFTQQQSLVFYIAYFAAFDGAHSCDS